MALQTFGNLVATAPLGEVASIGIKRLGGMAIIEDRVALHPLKVLVDSGSFKVGDVVYIDGNNGTRHAWKGQLYTIGDITFILVPAEFVVVVDKATP